MTITNYFAPEEKNVLMLVLAVEIRRYWCASPKKMTFTEISELISGGPAWRKTA
jgi:carboxyl-terminal processing protease